MSSAVRQPGRNAITVAQICTAIGEGRLRATISDGYYTFPRREAIRILRGVAQPLALPYREAAPGNRETILPEHAAR